MNLFETFKLGLILLLTDYLYLKSISKHFNNLINNIQGSEINLNLTSTLLCYFFIVFGLKYFIIDKNKNSGRSVNEIVWDAMLLGWTVYGIFETTNHAIFEKWAWDTVFLDTIWGGILYGLSTYLYLLTK